MHWRQNVFELPRGKIGLAFVDVSQMVEAYNNATALEGIAMKTVMVVPALLLHRPHPPSKTKDHGRLLEDRLMKWTKGDLESLLHEGQTIQNRLKVTQCQHQDEGKTARSFEKLVAMDNVKSALRLIAKHANQGCLPLDEVQLNKRTVK